LCVCESGGGGGGGKEEGVTMEVSMLPLLMAHNTLRRRGTTGPQQGEGGWVYLPL